jgi:hypothetical protein
LTVKEAVKGYGYVPGIYAFSIKEAQANIYDNEQLLFACIANATVESTTGKLSLNPSSISGKESGVFAITDKKVLFCSNVLGKGTNKQINLSNIQSIDDKTNLTGFSKIRIQGITEMITIDSNKKITSKIKETLNNL